MNPSLPELLATRLESPRPRYAARRRLESELSYGRHSSPAPYDARRAAVMILIYPGRQDWYLPLTLRPPHLPDHAGQISLPGGLIEPGEESRQAALRELREELGIPGRQVTCLGRLCDLYVFASNFVITPWVGAVSMAPAWVPNPDEVAEVIELPLGYLVNLANVGRTTHHHLGVAFESPFIALGKHRIWGATSMMLAELADILAELNTSHP